MIIKTSIGFEQIVYTVIHYKENMEENRYESAAKKAEQAADTVQRKGQEIGDTVNKKAEEIGDTVKEKIEGADAEKYLEMISKMLERLTEKHPTVSLKCDNVSFETETPDDSGNIIPEGKITINGKFTLSVE